MSENIAEVRSQKEAKNNGNQHLFERFLKLCEIFSFSEANLHTIKETFMACWKSLGNLKETKKPRGKILQVLEQHQLRFEMFENFRNYIRKSQWKIEFSTIKILFSRRFFVLYSQENKPLFYIFLFRVIFHSPLRTLLYWVTHVKASKCLLDLQLS